MSEPITNVEAAVRERGALPVPVGPQMPDFPPPPATELEKAHAERARLQELLAEAVRDAHLARRERDLIRERVSEPFGCKHCGDAKHHHGRQYIGGVGMHGWERPSDEQVRDRMLARRAARLPLPRIPELDEAHVESMRLSLALYEEELENARLRLALKSAQRGRRELRAQLAKQTAERAAWRRTAHHLAGEAGLIPKSVDGEHYAATHHDYRVSRDLPEAGGRP